MSSICRKFACIMEQNQSTTKTGMRYKDRHPQMYDVIMHNDDVTTMEFVVQVLEKVFRKNHAEAVDMMLCIHNNGKAVAGTYSYDIAHSKADKATAMARANRFPLLITVHQKKDN